MRRCWAGQPSGRPCRHGWQGRRGVFQWRMLFMVLCAMHAAAPTGRDHARAAHGAAADSPLRALHAVTKRRAALCTPCPTGKPVTMNIFPFQYAFNLFSHNSPMTDNGYNEEEMKLVGSWP